MKEAMELYGCVFCGMAHISASDTCRRCMYKISKKPIDEKILEIVSVCCEEEIDGYFRCKKCNSECKAVFKNEEDYAEYDQRKRKENEDLFNLINRWATEGV